MLGSPRADAEMGMTKQSVSLGEHLDSVPTEGRGRRQDGAEGEAELHALPAWAQPTPRGNLELQWPHRVVPSVDTGEGHLSHHLCQGVWATPERRRDPEPGSFLQVRQSPKGLTAGGHLWDIFTVAGEWPFIPEVRFGHHITEFTNASDTVTPSLMPGSRSPSKETGFGAGFP